MIFSSGNLASTGSSAANSGAETNNALARESASMKA